MKIENHERVEFLMSEIKTLKITIGDTKHDRDFGYGPRPIKCLLDDEEVKAAIRKKIKTMEREIEKL